MLSPMPDIREVAGQPAGHEENGVDADIVAGARVARRQPLGGDRDPPQPVGVERHRCLVLAGARLDLDEGDNAPAAGDEVDLTARHPRALAEDPPAMQPQPPGRQPLGLAPAPLGKLPPVQRLSSSARA
jgi:hypothetical protein